MYVGDNRSYGSPGRAYWVVDIGGSGSYRSPRGECIGWGRSYWTMGLRGQGLVALGHT